ncbi:unnamed protein product [Rotaria sp. Silwood2]|nr:unnamed protein product [Rotaria sp. Silwood2]
MLSYFQPELTSSNLNRKRAIVAQYHQVSLIKLEAYISKSSNSTTLTRIIRTGFTYFQHKSRVLKVINIPAERATKFTNAIIMDYNISLQGSFMLGLTYMDDFVWDYIEYLYSPAMNGNHRSLTLFKNGDNQTNTASFFIADINADW